MNKQFYSTLAWQNIKKNHRTYVPYLLTCIGTIMMFYMMVAIGENPIVLTVHGAGSMIAILYLGRIVIGIFAVLFILYTYSFLMKQRKKEFGLYNILGMEKQHIVKMVFYETLYVVAISCTLGIFAGFAFNKLAETFLCALLHIEVSMGITMSIPAVKWSLILFGSIFLCTLLISLLQIQISSPVELLKGGNVGEKEPKTKWGLFIIGTLALGVAYYLAQTTNNPQNAISNFFVAVILVMIGTYCLFTAGSIVVLKSLKKNRHFYYRSNNFTAISGMLYRMKQNAVGLANICILSTMVLVMLSSTVSLYLGIQDTLNEKFLMPLVIKVYQQGETTKNDILAKAYEVAKEANITLNDELVYSEYTFVATIEQNNFLTLTQQSSSDNPVIVQMIDIEDYNRILEKNIQLNPDEVLVYDPANLLHQATLCLNNTEVQIKEKIHDLEFLKKTIGLSMTSVVLVTTDDFQLANLMMNPDEIQTPDLLINLDGEVDLEKTNYFIDHMNSYLKQSGLSGYSNGRLNYAESIYLTHGGLLFIGLFLGILFVMATVLIIYYKQISEGYDDQFRFDIMQKVGMSPQEVKKTINKQIIFVFFLPLIVAIIHILFAFKLISMLLSLLQFGNMSLFQLCLFCSIIIFTLLYAIVYRGTSHVYYRIVKR